MKARAMGFSPYVETSLMSADLERDKGQVNLGGRGSCRA